MRYYELSCTGDPNLFQEKIISLIQDEKGLLIDSSKKTNLAAFNFQMEPENLVNFEKKLKEEKQISRCMILSKKPKKAGEAKMSSSWVEKPSRESKLPAGQTKQKVELGEIEKKLEEILKE